MAEAIDSKITQLFKRILYGFSGEKWPDLLSVRVLGGYDQSGSDAFLCSLNEVLISSGYDEYDSKTASGWPNSSFPMGREYEYIRRKEPKLSRKLAFDKLVNHMVDSFQDSESGIKSVALSYSKIRNYLSRKRFLQICDELKVDYQEVSNEDSCRGSYSFFINLKPDLPQSLFVNFDGINDYFRIGLASDHPFTSELIVSLGPAIFSKPWAEARKRFYELITQEERLGEFTNGDYLSPCRKYASSSRGSIRLPRSAKELEAGADKLENLFYQAYCAYRQERQASRGYDDARSQLERFLMGDEE